MSNDLQEARRKAALDYHELPTPGKLSVTATKQLLNQSDLALAYSPGVAAACEAIVENPLNVFRYTARANLVGVISNGTGAAALGCVDLLLDLGLSRENVWLTDLAGVVYQGRLELMDPEKNRFAQATPARTLLEVIGDADVFLGLSAGGVLTPEMVRM